MEWKFYILCISSLLVSLHQQSSQALPITDPDSDLDSIKTVLGRLEEKLKGLEANPEFAEDFARRPNDSGSSLQESAVTDSNPFPVSNAILQGRRSLQRTKKMRGNNCFGRRIDRIDSVSGMGCNGNCTGFRRI